jgi:hypothetical protein
VSLWVWSEWPAFFWRWSLLNDRIDEEFGFSERAKGIAVGHRELGCELLVACSAFCFVQEK